MALLISKKVFIYTVRQGDTLHAIAQTYGSSVEAIRRVNYLRDPVANPDLIYPGNVLVIPHLADEGEVRYVVQPGDTVSQIAALFHTTIEQIANLNQLTDPNLIHPDQQLLIPVHIYEVQSGDTLSAISQTYGVSLPAITKANEGRIAYAEDLIRAEFYLVIPDS